MVQENKIEKIQHDIEILNSALIYIPGTDAYKTWIDLIQDLKQRKKELEDPEHACTQKKFTDAQCKRLTEDYIADIEKRQGKLNVKQLTQLCRKQMQAHSKTQEELSASRWELKQWKEFICDVLIKAADKMRITAKSSKEQFISASQSLRSSKNPDVIEAYKIVNGERKDPKIYNIEKGNYR